MGAATLTKLLAYSRRAFQLGIVVSVIIMPLELVPAWTISLLSAAFTLLIVQYPLLKLALGQALPRLDRRRALLIASAFALPVLAVAISAVMAPESDASSHIVRITAVFAIRAWIIARFAEAEDIVVFEVALLWMAGIVTAFGYYQYLGDIAGFPSNVTLLISHYSSHGTYFFPRVHSFAHEPLYMANFLFLPIGLLIWHVLKEGRFTIVKSGLLAAMLGLFLSTNARGAIDGLIIALIVCLIVARPGRQQLKNLGIACLAGVVVTASLIGLAGIARGQNTLLAFSSHAVDAGDQSFTNRSHIWPQVVPIFKAHPVTGLGPANSRHYLANQTDFSLPVTSLPVFNNSFLTLIAEQGLIGVFAFVPLLIVFGLAVHQLWRRRGHFVFPYVLAVLAIAIQANTFEISELARTWIVLGALTASYRLCSQPDNAIMKTL